ncbi:MAG: ATP-dependent protease ATPase subunit HslU [Clostridia bacterium]|nr:ATP-dependent protease ATPase subunit HslU [Clostridia bacterium]MDY5263502.1 ATP-dependent protease ATPase subunit HslU [Eubacteriales bacterium]
MTYTPRQIVSELDRYIIGQAEAKRVVAVALRNRYRRSKLTEGIREEVTPKNIIMQGPTGVGKTEIARRLAKLVKAPFVKVEATKFTEVGYVGRDVESIIRDLVEASIRMVKEERIKEVKPKAIDIAERELVEKILPIRKQAEIEPKSDSVLKEEILSDLRKGQLDNIQIEMKVADQPKTIQLTPNGENSINLGDIFGGMMPEKKKQRKMTVKDAFDLIVNSEAAKLIDEDGINAEGLRRAEQDGIVFIDEIDKICGNSRGSNGPDVSREGVQRDILPIVEGCTINTKYGAIRTDFILFVAAGAFHLSKVSDLIPELQGRFPVIVQLENLTSDDFIRILSQTDNSLIKQYSELLGVDKVKLSFTEDGIKEIAEIATLENENKENLGARRLHALIEKVLEEALFTAGENSEEVEVVVDKKYVDEHLSSSVSELNLAKYIL